MVATPLISDIELTRYHFEPGDRLLVRIGQDLDAGRQTKLLRAVEKFTGEDVRILLVNYKTTRLMKVTPAGRAELICDDSMSLSRRKQMQSGKVELSCSVVDLQPNDILSVQLKQFPEGKIQKERVIHWLEQWTGKEVEIRLMPWV